MGAGRPPKCRICGAKLSIETAYKVITYNSKGTPSKAFYCSQEEYESKVVITEKPTKQKDKNNNIKKKVEKKPEKQRQSDPYKDKAYALICDIIGRKTILNTVLWKEWAVWNQVASNDILAQYLEENQKFLSGLISKLDNIEFNRIRYLSAVIKNKIGDYKPKLKAAQPVTISQDEHYKTKFKCRSRVALEDLEEECCE